MKLKHVITTLGLAAVMAFGVGAGLKASRKEVAKADITSCVVRGTLKAAGLETEDWSTGVAVGNKVGNEYQVLNQIVYTTDSFKFVVNGTNWLGYGQLQQAKSYFNNGDNLTVPKAAKFNFYVQESAIYCTFVEYVEEEEVEHTFGLIGSRDGFTADFASFEKQQDGSFVASNVSLTANEKFKIRADGAWTKSWGVGAFTSPTNYFEADKTDIKVLVSGSYTITLPSDFYANGTGATFTIDPAIADGIYLRGAWGENNYGWSEAGQRAMTVVTPGSVYSLDNIILGAGGTVKVVSYSAGLVTWGQPNTVSSTNADDYPVSITEPTTNKNVTVTNAGTYSLTVTKVGDDSYNYVFTGAPLSETLENAIAFAQGFNTAIDTACNGGETTLQTVNTAWSAQAEIFDDLDDDVKTLLARDLSGETEDDLVKFNSKYNYVYGRYSTQLTAGDFAGRHPSTFGVLTPVLESNNSVSMIIIVVASLSMISTAGFFFIRRRKEDR